MIHLGDITKISGYTAPTVDVVIGGSPCQDLSIAGKRAGLDGDRSGLFMEQIRIIKEMRENDIRRGRSGSDVRPRYMVWENVPGAFSSNKGEDFQIVLEETAKVADKDAVIPLPDKGKWTTSGCILGDGWSISWRILDAQFFGVPQRRRRIALVADFGGQSAPEILFVRKSVSGDTEPSEPKRKGTSSDAERGTGADDCTVEGFDCYNQTLTGDKSKTLNCAATDSDHVPCTVYSVENYPADSRVNLDESGKVQTLTSRMGTGGGNVPMVMESRISDVISLDRSAYNQVKNAQFNIGVDESGTAFSCIAKGPGAVAYGWYPQMKAECITWTEEKSTCLVNGTNPGFQNGICLKVNTHYIVRRLTPLECERLQGFPDGWTLIGEPVEEDVADYISKFDESKYIKPNYEDFGLTLDDIIDYQGIGDDELEDTEIENKLLAYRKALYEAECKATKRVKIGSHKETFYYYTDANGKHKKTSDAARYKALGNSIAIPPWKWVLKRLCACYERDATMASLFDGIGGFPLIWEQINGKGSCLWASEIEEFPIAVTKVRFGECT